MRYVLALLLICAGVGTAVVMYLNRPPTKKSRPMKTAPLVKVVEFRKTDVPVTIAAYGTVVPARQLTVQAQVEGRIIQQVPSLVPGGLIPAGSKLLQLDPEDYRIQIKELEAALTEAKFEVEVEQGKSVVAKREWKLLEKEIKVSDSGRRLVLRQPHMERAEARVQAAENRLAQAKLDEKRTTLTCPFNAIVIDESVEVGQLVSKQAKLATLVGTDQFWVQVLVPIGKLQRIRFPRGDEGGSTASVVCDTAGGSAIVRTGRVLRLLGDLNTSGRMARVLVAIDNPLDLSTPAPGQTATMGPQCILLGSYTKVEIQAGRLDGVYVTPREALREGDRLWTVGSERKLIYRDAEVIWRRRTDVLLRCDVPPGQKLVLSRLGSPLPGMTVRVHDPDKSPAASQPRTQPGKGR
ncbi:MAG: HlyD family efflux transporter periplasmic adaptor subunit [Phycisphaerae bacterium]|nr:HlyD family efflux transporter periplasmic adaptor subunit [Phycisphaerae bacterium]